MNKRGMVFIGILVLFIFVIAILVGAGTFIYFKFIKEEPAPDPVVEESAYELLVTASDSQGNPIEIDFQFAPPLLREQKRNITLDGRNITTNLQIVVGYSTTEMREGRTVLDGSTSIFFDRVNGSWFTFSWNDNCYYQRDHFSIDFFPDEILQRKVGQYNIVCESSREIGDIEITQLNHLTDGLSVLAINMSISGGRINSPTLVIKDWGNNILNPYVEGKEKFKIVSSRESFENSYMIQQSMERGTSEVIRIAYRGGGVESWDFIEFCILDRSFVFGDKLEYFNDDYDFRDYDVGYKNQCFSFN